MDRRTEAATLISKWVADRQVEYDGDAYPLGYLSSLVATLAGNSDVAFQTVLDHFGPEAEATDEVADSEY